MLNPAKLRALLFVPGLLVVMLLLGSGIAPADAATPTPTLYIVPPKPNSFPVPTGAPPWPTPALPTYPPLTPSPTLYNATAIHATDYPNQVSTATAQIGLLHEPINTISTPVAFLIGAAGTPSGGDIDTGMDVDGEPVTLLGWSNSFTDGIAEAVANAVGFATETEEFLSYSPVLQNLVMTELTLVAVSIFLPIMTLIVRAVKYIILIFGILRILLRSAGF